MADDTTATDAQDQSTDNRSATDEEIDWKAEAEKWKTMARKNEDRAKANAERAQKYDAVVESQKTAEQRAAEALAKAEKDAHDAKVRAVRAEVAAIKGVPAELLTGETEAEVEEAANKILKFRGEQTPDFGGGNRGDDVGGRRAQWTKSDLQGKTPEEINKARKEGLLDRLMGKRS